MTKHISILILLLLLCNYGIAQKMPEEYYEDGKAAFAVKNNKKGIAEYSYFVNHYPHNWRYPDLCKTLGEVCFSEKYYDSAIVVFRKILADTSWYNNRIRHEASVRIYEAFMAACMYDSALKQCFLSDTIYRFRDGCGNAMEDEDGRSRMRFFDVYEKLGRYREAEQTILKVVLKWPLSNPSRLMTMLQEHEDVVALQKEFKTAMKKWYPPKKGGSEYDYLSYFSYIEFLGTRMYLPQDYDYHRVYSLQAVKMSKNEFEETFIKQTSFYKMLMALPVKKAEGKAKR